MGRGKVLGLLPVQSLSVGVVRVREDESLRLVWESSRGDAGECKGRNKLHDYGCLDCVGSVKVVEDLGYLYGEEKAL